MCPCANNYWKSVSSKCLRVIMLLYASTYILEYSRKKNIIKENIYDEVGMLSLIAECNFTKQKFLLQTFSNKSSKTDYQ